MAEHINFVNLIWIDVRYLVFSLSFSMIRNQLFFLIKGNSLEVSHSCCTSTQTEQQQQGQH